MTGVQTCALPIYDFYLGAFQLFWRDTMLLTDQAKATAERLRVPALVLQGDLDENVTKEDFQALQAATAGRPKAGSSYFPSVGHMFNQYGETAVAPAVLRRIASWLDDAFAANGQGGTL